MRTDSSVVEKSRPALRSKTLKVGSKASFSADVLRVLPSGCLLVMVQANGIKLTLAPDVLDGGSKLRGGDKPTLTGTITRVGDSISDEFTPISIAVDGYTASRVTVGKKWVKPL